MARFASINGRFVLCSPKRTFALSKQRRFWRIKIFGRALIAAEHAPAEGDYFADIVADGKHDSAAETIVSSTLNVGRWTLDVSLFLFLRHEPALNQHLLHVTAFPRPIPKRLPLVRRETDLPVPRHAAIDPALLQIFTRRRGPLALQEIFMKPFRGLRVQLQQRAPRFMLPIIIPARPAFLDHWDARTRRQFLHRGGKIEMLVIHHEPENAAAGTAAETMKRLALLADVERGRFLLMEWAERLVTRTRALERKIRPDHLDDVVSGGDLFNVSVGIVPMSVLLFARSSARQMAS